MKYKFATIDDAPLLAVMNKQLAEDEQHRNQFKSEQWFKERMIQFLNGGYTAVLFEKESVVAYALYRNHPEHEGTIHLRQIFVSRDYRRQGIGREVINILKNRIWPKEKRFTVEVLFQNEVALKFYKSVGYKEYCLELEMKAEKRNL